MSHWRDDRDVTASTGHREGDNVLHTRHARQTFSCHARERAVDRLSELSKGVGRGLLSVLDQARAIVSFSILRFSERTHDSLSLRRWLPSRRLVV